jgi:hypothetical protein
MSSYNEQLQALADLFMAETGRFTFTGKEVGVWALQNGHWQPHPDSVVRQFAHDFSRALREHYITNPHGRRIRAKHAIRQDGEQGSLWADIHYAPREHMVVAFQQRRQQIVSDCCQLKRDIDSYNENQNSEAPIQLVLDFTYDVAESELLDA